MAAVFFMVVSLCAGNPRLRDVRGYGISRTIVAINGERWWTEGRLSDLGWTFVAPSSAFEAPATARKRGGGVTALALEDVQAGPSPEPVDILALDEALAGLAALDRRLCEVVEMRFFAGLSTTETSEALGVSTATVERDWTVAKAWLLQRLSLASRH